MAEKGLFFFTNGFTGATGDGAAPYTEEEFRNYNRALFEDGVMTDFFNELAVSGTASPVTVATGGAWVGGFPYFNSAAETLTVTTPSVGTTGGRVVVRMDRSAATVRLAVKMSTDGVASFPARTLDVNGIFEISLATISITTGGVITLVDDRDWSYPRTLRLDNVTVEESSRNILRVKDGGITAAKAGAGVPIMIERRGGSATDWGVAGSTDYAVSNVEITCGAAVSTLLGGSAFQTATANFPRAFAQPPLVVAQIANVAGSDPYSKTLIIQKITVSTTAALIYYQTTDNSAYAPPGVDRDVTINWTALGLPV